MCENREIANTVLNLGEFKSPLVNKKGFNIIGTGIGLKFFFRVHLAHLTLQCMVGISGTEQKIDTDRVNLEPRDGVYVPVGEFVACDPMPEEWLESLPNVIEGTRKLQ